MARKKAKAKGPDTRGYNQQNNQDQAPPKRSTPSHEAELYDVSKPRMYTLHLTKAMETQLREFLGEFPLPQTEALPSDRFGKRITNIYDRLIDLGFAFQDIQQAVLQLRYHITLDLALDWLCWHVDVLPPRFTDERFDVSTNSSSVWVEPMTKAVRSAENSSTVETRSVAPFEFASPGTPYKKMQGEDRSDENDTSMSDAHKQWLLSQYQYEEEDEETEAENDLSMPLDDSLSGTILREDDELHRDRLKLKQLKVELEPLESQLNDEASCYMMSKHELKAMRGRVKPLKRQIKVLEEKIAGRERKLALQSPVHELSVDEDCEEDSLLDIFSMSIEDINPSIDKSMSSQMKQGAGDEDTQTIPRDSVPKSWTGMKPKALLEDFCRRQKLPQPSFQRMTKTSCILRMKGSTGEGKVAVIHQDGPTLADAQHFAAAKALFQLDSKANIQHLLPPFHRQVWSEWKSSAKLTENRIKLDEGAKRRNEIDQLLNQLAKNDEIGRQKYAFKKEEHGLDDLVDMKEQREHSWEEVKESSLSSSARLCQENIQLKNEFETIVKSEKYQRHLELREKLPVYGFRESILEAIENNPVTIISAETGAGKTTQVPQFLLSTALLQGKGGHTSIICTQPRRVAATSVAERVAEEVGERSVGGLVGYQIRMESSKSSRTKLLFCTTGVILRRLIEDPLLNGVSHLVVDEVHERQWQIDVLLMSLKTLMQGRRPDLKVILMSATLDSGLFSSYFWSAPVLSVPGRTFPVKNYFLEDLLEKTGHIIEEDSRYAQRSFARMDTVDLRVTERRGRKRRDVAYVQSQTDIEVSNEFMGYSVSTRR
ncbi:hypothetical protein FisN_3Lh136 [Fistulifera solaris]|uniref:RNA helicase n=1 Tax=Fistulifera solaris TaxID=1519565 RepID=A0A1Z5JIG3_FISSO|nr:hypothetical protein FisN_3Lh136 [Fistulifera solaris]|eukprot:GAX13568.1 hypothetical protein FisN_3Lh136 [Fistulifera solaris]